MKIIVHMSFPTLNKLWIPWQLSSFKNLHFENITVFDFWYCTPLITKLLHFLHFFYTF